MVRLNKHTSKSKEVFFKTVTPLLVFQPKSQNDTELVGLPGVSGFPLLALLSSGTITLTYVSH